MEPVWPGVPALGTVLVALVRACGLGYKALKGLEARLARQIADSEARVTAEIKGFREANTAQHDELHAKVDGVQTVAETGAKDVKAMRSKVDRLDGFNERAVGETLRRLIEQDRSGPKS